MMKKNGRYLWLFFFVLFNISGVKGNTEINPISIKNNSSLKIRQA